MGYLSVTDIIKKWKEIFENDTLLTEKDEVAGFEGIKQIATYGDKLYEKYPALAIERDNPAMEWEIRTVPRGEDDIYNIVIVGMISYIRDDSRAMELADDLLNRIVQVIDKNIILKDYWYKVEKKFAEYGRLGDIKRSKVIVVRVGIRVFRKHQKQ